LQPIKEIEYDLKTEIKKANNLTDLRLIQSRIKNNIY